MLPGKRDTLFDMETPVDAPEGAKPSRVWPFLFEPRWIGWHLFVVAAFWGMLALGDWQFRRAMAGNGLSWAYTFEWPLFAGFGVVFWVRTIRDEFRLRRGIDGGDGDVAAATAESALPAGLGILQVEQPADDADDLEVANYNAYLAKLNGDAYLAKLNAEVRKTHGKNGSR